MNLQNMAPNAKRSLIITLIFLSLSIVVYIMAIKSTEHSISKAKKQLAALTASHRTMTKELAEADKTKAKIAALQTRLADYESAC